MARETVPKHELKLLINFLYASTIEVYGNNCPEHDHKLLTNIPTNKGNKMRNRFRIEIFDEVKANDLTLYSDQGVDRDHLVEIMFSNARRFQGNVKAFVYDNLKKKKTAAARLSMETISKINNHQLTNVM